MPEFQSFPPPHDGYLTPAMGEAWARDGFLVLEGFADPQAINVLRARIDALVDGFDATSVRTVFDASEQDHAADLYFRESGDKVRFFFEPGAFGRDGSLVAEKRRALNKIGHALHDLDPEFDRFCRDSRLARLAEGLDVVDPLLVQSMVIFKQPKIGAEVGMHQDATFLHTDPPSVIGFWFALEGADRTNGCLLAVPGGHRGPLIERFHHEGEKLVMTALEDAAPAASGPVALEVSAGTLVVLNGLLPHGSAPNRSPRSREAFALHIVDGAARWSSDNWLRRDPAMPFRGFA